MPPQAAAKAEAEANPTHEDQDDNEVSAEEGDIDVAALMGFASFGNTSKPNRNPQSNKKRKLDHNYAGTGANSVAVGMKARKSQVNNTAGQAGDGGGAEAMEVTETVPTVSAVSHTSTHGSEHHAVGNTGGEMNEEPGARRGKLQNGGWDFAALRRGVRDENGDMAYFDKSFVEDPWARILQRKMDTSGG